MQGEKKENIKENVILSAENTKARISQKIFKNKLDH